MKKILAALMLGLVSIASSGQIQVQKHSSYESRDVVRAMGFSSSATIVEEKVNGVVSYSLRTITTNQFDKTFLLLLGYNEKEVVESINALYQMALSAKGDSFIINAETTASVVAKGTLYIKGEGYAGYASLTKKQIEKFINFYAEGGH